MRGFAGLSLVLFGMSVMTMSVLGALGTRFAIGGAPGVGPSEVLLFFMGLFAASLGAKVLIARERHAGNEDKARQDAGALRELAEAAKRCEERIETLETLLLDRPRRSRYARESVESGHAPWD